MQPVAVFIAQNALAVLLAVAALMLMIAALVWRAIQSFKRELWPFMTRVWRGAGGEALMRHAGRAPLVRSAFDQTSAVWRYLGVYAVLSFVFALAAVGVFFELADEIEVDEELARFDTALTEALAAHLSPELLTAAAWVTHLGDPRFLTVLGAAVALALLAHRERLLAIAWVVATLSGAVLSRLLKAIFERTRPVHEHGLVVAEGWSFPSGHASGSMLVYGLLCYVVVRHAPRSWRAPITAACALLIVFVGFSRVLLQVHYLSDVLAGYAWAAAWCALCVMGLEATRWRVSQSTAALNPSSRS